LLEFLFNYYKPGAVISIFSVISALEPAENAFISGYGFVYRALGL
jgi:hypothetical protein